MTVLVGSDDHLIPGAPVVPPGFKVGLARCASYPWALPSALRARTRYASPV